MTALENPSAQAIQSVRKSVGTLDGLLSDFVQAERHCPNGKRHLMRICTGRRRASSVTHTVNFACEDTARY